MLNVLYDNKNTRLQNWINVKDKHKHILYTGSILLRCSDVFYTLHKTDIIIAVVAQVSDVAHIPLVVFGQSFIFPMYFHVRYFYLI